MPILQSGQEIKIIRLSVDLDQFPNLLVQHVRSSKIRTADVEQLGSKYIAGGFQHDQTMPFIEEVCRWGNYAGVSGKVRENNKVKALADTFEASHKLIMLGKVQEAITKIIEIKSLNVSFGSKHLKFLAPEHAVVLDSIISEHLGYPRTKEGYAEFLQDCFVLRESWLGDSEQLV